MLEPGTLDVIQVVIPDADAALAELRAKGVEAEGVEARGSTSRSGAASSR